MKNNKQPKRWFMAASLGALLAVTGGSYWLVEHPEYLIRSSSERTIKQASQAVKKQPQVWVFYQPGCQACRKVAVQLLVTGWQLKLSNQSEVVHVDTKLARNRAVVKQFSIKHTPTIIRRSSQHYWQYQGTNTQKIKAIMTGEN
ncbi:thioredoxin domain-containing protein [Lactiplantibacillus plantarum]|uniref:thioredoxin domain-containing protein n=1 Tax=Lactiplantibacillus plantarum TaxID=1590 RepID=UPI001BA5021E|nr:thioredoxin domain-containing protein [Lactiplantibacillus plantarum]MBS0935704.1 hypothetical protein [Lactiplantibacillus plantarum]MBS0943939.1 hypothetical protein [Lactiplantibacillus plantarum]MBS0955472.1 hypothetical protein [Lactiplantibacillus plantarum]